MPVYRFTLDQFVVEMQKQAQNIVDAEKKIVVVAAQEILGNLVPDTAVDTGKARSNWLVTLGGPWSSGAIDPFAPGKHLGKAEQANRQMALALGNAVLTGRGSEVPVYITNNAPHIGALNEGNVRLRPENAPQNPGFIEAAIVDGLNSAGVASVRFIHP